MAREINLVPDIKGEMIKALKLRNFIFFLCIVVAAASVGVTLFFGTIVGGQQIAIDGKIKTIDNLSKRMNSYSDLNDFLTIKDQLSNLSLIGDNKKVMSRTFNILSALLPTGADTIRISKLDIYLSGDYPVFQFDAHANAGKAPYIDYNVLDSFKKSLKYIRYDYGSYVDKYGETIPAYCMIETNVDDTFFYEMDKGFYAYWDVSGEGCNPSSEEDEDDEDDSKNTIKEDQNGLIDGYATEEYNGKRVVRIWRTPQYDEWYKENPKDDEPYMDLGGNISNVPHFESACITYTGEANQDDFKVKWTEENDTCKVVPTENEDGGITIIESSNGRDETDELVLRFTAAITFNTEIFDFDNTHMLILPPSNRINVTDSYLQIQDMFGQRAKDCAKDDTACKANGGS